jgi:hypothetical protein
MRQRSWWVGCTVLVAACGGDGHDGANGTDGIHGLNALVATTAIAPGGDCVAGGYEVRAGQDANDDGKLGPEETSSTDYVCNGEPGADDDGSAGAEANPTGAASLVSVTTLPPGDDCNAGGLRLEAGVDTDGSGSLEASEVTTSRALCNGEPGEPGTAAAKGDPGIDALIVTHPEPTGAHCPNGGTRIDVGQDADRDAALSVAEVASTSYVCNGENGAMGAKGATGAMGTPGLASLVVVAEEPAGDNCTYGGNVITSGVDDGLPSGTAGNGVLEPGEVNAAVTTYLCRPQQSLQERVDAASEVISLHLEGTSVSSDFAVVEHLGTENAVIEQVLKTGAIQRMPGNVSNATAVLHGRFTGKELTELVNWRKTVETAKFQRLDLVLTATDLSTNLPIAAWQLQDAWPSSLEIEETANGGAPLVTVELAYGELTRSKVAGVAESKHAVHLTANAVDTTCASVTGIGSESDVVVSNIKGMIITTPGALDYGDAVCTRPLDGDFDLTAWRQAVIDTGANARRPATVTLPDTSAFDLTNAWPAASSVDTGPDGQLVETVTLVTDVYTKQ